MNLSFPKWAFYLLISILIIISLLIFFVDIELDSVDIDRKNQFKERINSFTLNGYRTKEPILSFEEIKFRLIQDKDLNNLKKTNTANYVYIWGSWCKPCVEKLPILDSLLNANNSIDIHLVAMDYNIPKTQKVLFEAPFLRPTFIFESEEEKLRPKAEQFVRILCDTCLYNGAFPFILKYDGTGTLVNYGSSLEIE